MNEQQKEVMAALEKAIPKMNEFQLGKLLGMAETLTEMEVHDGISQRVDENK